MVANCLPTRSRRELDETVLQTGQGGISMRGIDGRTATGEAAYAEAVVKGGHGQCNETLSGKNQLFGV